MSANAEVLDGNFHAFDFSRQRFLVKAAVAWPGFLAKLLLPQFLSADYSAINHTVPLTDEALTFASGVEMIGLMAVAAAVKLPQYFQLENKINVAQAVLASGIAFYGAGRTLSLGVEAGNWFARQNKKAREAEFTEQDLAGNIRSLFINPESEIEFNNHDTVRVFPKTAAEAMEATGVTLNNVAATATHIFEFQIINVEKDQEDVAVNNFSQLFAQMQCEAESFAVEAKEKQAIAFYAILGRFNRFRSFYKNLVLRKKRS